MGEAGFCGDGIDDVDAGGPVAIAAWVAEFGSGEVADVAVDESGVGEEALLRGRGKGVVVGFDGIE